VKAFDPRRLVAYDLSVLVRFTEPQMAPFFGVLHQCGPHRQFLYILSRS
jgi:hypothetical protein